MRLDHGQFLCCVAAAAVFAVGAAHLLAADDFSAAPCTIADGENGVLLLQDGGVLNGQITRAADSYVVSRAGGQMQVAAMRVQFVGRTLHEVYEFRRDRMVHESVEAKLGLADWCLRHNLLVEAGETLANVQASAPDHPRLALLSRRLVATKERPATGTVAVSASMITANATAKSEASAKISARQEVSPDLPSGVLEQFTRKVQPVLVNSCTTSRCHEPGGQQSFQLNRASVRGEANRRTTMQNLAAALALVDRDHPNDSLLLVVPRKTHGGMTGPVFGPRQEQAFKHLADWVAMISPPPQEPEELPADGGETTPAVPSAEATASTSPAASTAPPASLVAPPAKPIARHTASARTNKRATKVDPAVAPAAATEEQPIESLRLPHRLKIGVKGEKWQPRDAFDPEIFNRAGRVNAVGPAEASPSQANAASSELPPQ